MGSDAARAAKSSSSTLVSAAISGILCLVIFATLRFYADWFNLSQANTMMGGFLGSWLFVLSLTSVSNVEMVVFGADFQVKIPEIIFCLTLAVIAAGVVHRVCATTCILFSIVGLYFVNRISSNFHNKAAAAATEPPPMRRASSKKTK